MMTLKRRDGISLAKVSSARSPAPSLEPQKAASSSRPPSLEPQKDPTPPPAPSVAGNSVPAPQENGDALPEDAPNPQRRRRRWDDTQEAASSQEAPVHGVFLLHIALQVPCVLVDHVNGLHGVQKP